MPLSQFQIDWVSIYFKRTPNFSFLRSNFVFQTQITLRHISPEEHVLKLLLFSNLTSINCSSNLIIHFGVFFHLANSSNGRFLIIATKSFVPLRLIYIQSFSRLQFHFLINYFSSALLKAQNLFFLKILNILLNFNLFAHLIIDFTINYFLFIKYKF